MPLKKWPTDLELSSQAQHTLGYRGQVYLKRSDSYADKSAIPEFETGLLVE